MGIPRNRCRILLLSLLAGVLGSCGGGGGGRSPSAPPPPADELRVNIGEISLHSEDDPEENILEATISWDGRIVERLVFDEPRAIIAIGGEVEGVQQAGSHTIEVRVVRAVHWPHEYVVVGSVVVTAGDDERRIDVGVHRAVLEEGDSISFTVEI